MQALTEEQLLDSIRRGKTVNEALIENCFIISIQEYVPYVCTAIHAGHEFADADKCLLGESQRRLEEDPITDQFIKSFPITLIGFDSRYKYDLNRDPKSCIYESAWGQPVLAEPLKKNEKEQRIKKHSLYYRVLQALIASITDRFGGCLIFDIHSYNWQVREYPEAPIFNVGTAHIDITRYRSLLDLLSRELAKIEIPNLQTSVGENIVFEGRGYQAQFVQERLPKALNIPLEIKKIFMDEKTGEAFPLVIEAIKKGLYQVIINTTAHFTKSKVRRADLIPGRIEPIVIQVDKALYKLSKNIETLPYVNPINMHHEKKAFFSKRKGDPQFKYRQLKLEPYTFREELYRLPVSQIQDPLLRDLYRSVVDGLAKKIDLLTSVGTPQFLYHSLCYYGEPTEKDIANAHYLLHCKEFTSDLEAEANIDAEMVKRAFEEKIDEHGIKFKVAVTTKIIAKAMVNNSKKTLFVNKEALMTQKELNALINHEFGVHVMTTLNGWEQPLRVFSLGLPGNTETQEGLAILAEYLSGNLTIKRLKILALRVLVIEMMIKGLSFRSVHRVLVEEYNQNKDEAFNLAVRVFRGGGYTKDYLYLSGFRQAVSLYNKRSLQPLFIGKTSTQFFEELEQLMERGTLKEPQYMPKCIEKPNTQNNILDYLVEAIN